MPRTVSAQDRQDVETVSDFIRYAVAQSGRTGKEISKQIGRSENFIWSTLKAGSIPRLDTFVAIANACGYYVEVSSFGEFGQDEEHWAIKVGSDGQLSMVLIDATPEEEVTATNAYVAAALAANALEHPESTTDLDLHQISELLQFALSQILKYRDSTTDISSEIDTDNAPHGESTQLDAILEMMADDKKLHAAEVIGTFCTRYDKSRLGKIKLVDLLETPSGYVFVDVNGNKVARCFYDTFTGEPVTAWFSVPVPVDADSDIDGDGTI